MIKYIVNITSVLVMSCLFSLSVDAADARIYAQVDRVDYQRAEVVLDDQYFQIALNIKVFDEFEKQTTIYGIKRGRAVYYTAVDGKVNQVWLLPADSVRPKGKGLIQ